MSEQMTIGTDLGTFDAAEVLRGEEVRRLCAELEKREAQVSALEELIEDMKYDLANAKSEARDAVEDAENAEDDLRLAKARAGKLKAHVSSALRILGDAAEAACEVPDGYALREAVLCAVEALRGERATHDTEIDDLRRRLASIARDASEALPPGAGPVNVSSYHAMARALDRIAAVALIGAEEGEP